MAGRYTVEGIFRMQDRLTRPLHRIQTRLERFQRATSVGFRQLRETLGTFRTQFLAVGAAIASMAAAAAMALRDVIETGMEFDRVMAMTGARFGVARTSEEFAALERAAIDASRTSGFTSQQVAEALAELGASGASASEAIAQLPSILATAAAAGIELQEASDLTTDTLTMFGLVSQDSAQQARNLARVSDVMAAAANSTSMSFEQLVGAMGNVGATAHSAGMSIETTSALIGQLAEAGEKGDRAGTGLNAMLANLRTPTSQARRALRQLGIVTRNTDGSMRDAVDILGNFESSLAGMNDQARDTALARIFNEQGLRPMQLLLARGSQAVRTLRTDLQNAAGSAAEMAAQMQDSAAGDMAAMNAEIEALKLNIWGLIRGPVREIVQGITAWTSANQELISTRVEDSIAWLTENGPAIVTWARRIGIAIVAISIPFAIITAAMVAIPAIFVLVVAAIIEAAVWLYDNIGGILDSIVETFRGMWDSIVAFFTPAIEFLVGLFVILRAMIMKQLEPVFALLGRGVAWVRERWAPVGAFFSGLWAGVAGAFRAVWSALMSEAGGFVLQLQEIWEPIGAFFSALWDGIVDQFRAAFGPILAGIGDFVDSVRGVGRAAMDEEEGGESAAARARVVSPQERTARSVSETTRTERAEVTIRDETGRAQAPRRPRARNARIRLQPSGAM